MKKTKQDFQEEKVRLDKALQYLKELGYSQQEFANALNCTTSNISQMRGMSYDTKVSQDMVDLLKNYGINPEYIKGISNIMIDINGSKLECLEKITSDWKTVEGENNRYLHLCLDKNFYDFLLDVDYAKIVEESANLKISIDKLKEKYLTEENIQEYVLIPRNTFFEIITNHKKDRKFLSEIIDFSDYEDYLDANT